MMESSQPEVKIEIDVAEETSLLWMSQSSNKILENVSGKTGKLGVAANFLSMSHSDLAENGATHCESVPCPGSMASAWNDDHAIPAATNSCLSHRLKSTEEIETFIREFKNKTMEHKNSMQSAEDALKLTSDIGTLTDVKLEPDSNCENEVAWNRDSREKSFETKSLLGINQTVPETGTKRTCSIFNEAILAPEQEDSDSTKQLLNKVQVHSDSSHALISLDDGINHVTSTAARKALSFTEVRKETFPDASEPVVSASQEAETQTKIHLNKKHLVCLKQFWKNPFPNSSGCRHNSGINKHAFCCEESGCGKQFTKRFQLNRHRKKHIGIKLLSKQVGDKQCKKLFICDESGCDKQFAKSYRLKRHKKMHTREKRASPQKFCDEQFSLCKVKFEVMKQSDEESSGALVSDDDKNSAKHPMKRHRRKILVFCPEPGCSKTFSRTNNLKDHMSKHKGEKPYVCQVQNCMKSFAYNTSLKAHMAVHTGEKPHVCPEEGCDKAFIYPTNLKYHMRQHSGEKPFVCTHPECGKRFTLQHQLVQHLRAHLSEPSITLFVCPETGCGKSFMTSSGLRYHAKIHSGIKAFCCPESTCDKRFISRKQLKYHLKVHADEKSFFMCSEKGCSKLLSCAASLKNHMKLHSGERPFCCPELGCDKSFLSKPQLNYHLKLHANEKPFHCSQPSCGKRFARNAELRTHLRTHSAERPLLCPEHGCEKCFKYSSSLRAHIKTHEKQFHCSACSESFSRFPSLKKHEKSCQLKYCTKADGIK